MSACATSGVQRSFPDFHVSGSEFGYLTEAENPYSLERQVIFNREFYIQRVSVMGEELPFIFLPFNKTRSITNLDTGKERLESNENYIPRKVRIESENRLAREVDLMMERSPEGIKGVKADILSLEELRKRVGASRNSSGFNGITTEQDAKYRIGEVNILGVNYFYPHVETEKTGEDEALDFYIIPRTGTELIIHPGGMITLRNPGNIYRPTLITREEISASQVEIVRKE